MEKKNVKDVKSQMIKICKALSFFIAVLKWIFVLGIIFGIVLSFAMVKKIDGNVEETTGQYNQINESNANIEKNKKGEDIKDDIIDLYKILLIFGIIECIDKIMKETVKKETPFTEKNIKLMEKVSLASLASMFVIEGIGIIHVFVIVIMTYIFKYGYTLQIESDETL